MKKTWILVIIALSLIVLTYLNYSRINNSETSKSSNADIKVNLSNIRANSAYIYEDEKSYTSVCTSESNSSWKGNVKKATKTSIKCFADQDSFVMSAKLKKEINGKGYFCIDSVWSIKEITTEQYRSITNADTLCS